MNFSADFEILGKIEHHELKEGGDEITVNEENKLEYLEYVYIRINKEHNIIQYNILMDINVLFIESSLE